MRSDLKNLLRYQISPSLVCHLSQLYLSSGAPNLYFHRDPYTLPQSYSTTSASMETRKELRLLRTRFLFVGIIPIN